MLFFKGLSTRSTGQGVAVESLDPKRVVVVGLSSLPCDTDLLPSTASKDISSASLEDRPVGVYSTLLAIEGFEQHVP